MQEELKKRAASGSYKGSFAPVTHFFGYQARSAHPSTMDCSLGTTLGFGAAVLIRNGLSGYTMSVKDLTKDPSGWRVGGVPLMALLRSQPAAGFERHQLIVNAQKVQLTDAPYQAVKANEHAWRFVDHYSNPGPIQYSGFGADSTSKTVEELFTSETDIAD